MLGVDNWWLYAGCVAREYIVLNEYIELLLLFISDALVLFEDERWTALGLDPFNERLEVDASGLIPLDKMFDALWLAVVEVGSLPFSIGITSYTITLNKSLTGFLGNVILIIWFHLEFEWDSCCVLWVK